MSFRSFCAVRRISIWHTSIPQIKILFYLVPGNRLFAHCTRLFHLFEVFEHYDNLLPNSSFFRWGSLQTLPFLEFLRLSWDTSQFNYTAPLQQSTSAFIRDEFEIGDEVVVEVVGDDPDRVLAIYRIT